MPIVYRVENDKARGPYDGGFCYGYTSQDLYNLKTHPSPDDSFSSFSSRGTIAAYRFAFSSRAQLYRWFHKETLDDLRTVGYNVKRYQVAKKFIIKLRKQVAFRHDKGKRL